MDRTVILFTVALAACGCGMPFHYGNYGGGPRPPVERELRLAAPRLSPDGKAILFAFRYKQLPWKLALVPVDPEARVAVLKLPPMDDWIDPNFGPDDKHFTAVSFCGHDPCYEGAKGYNIWRITAQPADNLKRITPDAPNVRRARPVFGATAEDLYWFVSDATEYPNVHLDVSDRYLAHMADGKEVVLFPALPANGDIKGKHGRNDPGDLEVISADGAGRYDEAGYYFTGMIAGGNTKPAETALDRIGKYRGALFRHTPAGFELVEPVEVQYVDAPRGNRGYVAMAHHFIMEHTNAVADVRAMRDGQTLWSFRFHSQAYSLSVSDDLQTVVFDGERSFIDEHHIWHPKLQDAVFLWHQGMTEPVDLNIPERLRATVDAEIAAEKAAAGPSAQGASPTP